MVRLIQFSTICNTFFGFWGFQHLFHEDIQFIFINYPKYEFFYFILKLYYFILFLSGCFFIGFVSMEMITHYLCRYCYRPRPSAQIIRLPKVKKHLASTCKTYTTDTSDQIECAICLDNFKEND